MGENICSITRKDIFASFVKNLKNQKMKSYTDNKCYKDVISYVCGFNNDKHIRYLGGYGVDYTNINNVVKQFKTVNKQLKQSNKGVRKLYHFFMSFGNPEFDPNNAQIIGATVAEHIFEIGFQCIYAVHEEAGHIHIHFVFNARNYLNGKLFHANINELNEFLEHIIDVAVAV